MKRILPIHTALPALGAALLATSCVTTEPSYQSSEDPRLQHDLDQAAGGPVSESTFSWWHDEQPGNGPLRVTLDLSRQAAYFYRGRTVVGRSRIATGRASHHTPPGEYAILEKTADKHSNLYGRILDAEGEIVVYDADSRRDEIPEGGSFVGASMAYWMRLSPDGIGMHAGPIPRPGSPASHGCIRLPSKMARILFENSRIGTPVTIVNELPQPQPTAGSGRKARKTARKASPSPSTGQTQQPGRTKKQGTSGTMEKPNNGGHTPSISSPRTAPS